MRTLLAPTAPTDFAIPAELEQAWDWLEARGYGLDRDGRYHLSVHDDSVPHLVVFTPAAGLTGWFEADSAAADRLLPIAEGGDGSVVALWGDGSGQEQTDAVRVVVLGSEGEAYVLAESVVDFLVLLAIGYTDLIEFGVPPEDDAAVAAVADFRAWVQDTHGVSVPPEWAVEAEDDFTDWVQEQRGEPSLPAVAAPDAPMPGTSTVTGEVVVLLDALGHADGTPELAAVADLAGFALGDSTLGRKGAALRKAGIAVNRSRKQVTTLFVTVSSDGAERAYPRPAALIDGLVAQPTLAEARAVLGEPERSGGAFLRYLVRGRYLHLEFGAEGRLSLITLMVEAP